MANIENTPTYNLGVVVQETGINPDTLRAWERRYGLPLPERSEGGHRLYSERDIETVKWLLDRQDEGLRIGRAVKLWKDIQNAGEDPLQEYPDTDPFPETYQGADPGRTTGSEEIYALVRDAWLDAALKFEEEKAEQILSEAFARYSLQDVWEEILVKGLAQVGESWYAGEISVQQEHFATSLVIQRLHNLIDAAPPPIRKDVITVACPPGEYHTVAPLLITLFLRRKGYPVIYLGANVPLMDLDTSLEQSNASMVILTAQVLDTAASLVIVAEALVDNGYVVGYGGRVFNRLPKLTERTPGIFLGHQLTDVAERAEDILKSNHLKLDNFSPASAESNQYLEAFESVELRLWDRILRNRSALGMSKKQILMVNEQLGMAIRASLTFDQMDYITEELNWVRGLLGSRDIPFSQLEAYLLQVAEQLSDLLDEEQNPISETILKASDILREFHDHPPS